MFYKKLFFIILLLSTSSWAFVGTFEQAREAGLHDTEPQYFHELLKDLSLKLSALECEPQISRQNEAWLYTSYTCISTLYSAIKRAIWYATAEKIYESNAALAWGDVKKTLKVALPKLKENYEKDESLLWSSVFVTALAALNDLKAQNNKEITRRSAFRVAEWAALNIFSREITNYVCSNYMYIIHTSSLDKNYINTEEICAIFDKNIFAQQLIRPWFSLKDHRINQHVDP
jgi:hypothetical protein